MKRFFLLILLLPVTLWAHPGIAIVADSKGNIYYSDLQQVYRISDGKKTVAVPNVHTHELYIDAADNLYGEHQSNTSDDRFFHYLWVLHPDGRLDTVISQRAAFEQIDFSLARDRQGNEYYTKQFIRQRDTAHIYKKAPGGQETVLARGNFKGVSWLHPQNDGSLLFARGNEVYRMTADGAARVLATNIAAANSSFSDWKMGPILYGLWQDSLKNVYVAVFSDQVVKKIAADGTVSERYHSPGRWTPIQGVFDGSGQLWVMETNDKNETRVVKVPALVKGTSTTDDSFSVALIAILIAVGGFFLYRFLKRKK